ncbi:MAG: hypothetical protein EBR34_08280 [Sphingomonadaceae bacterium]|nr:hypothetical protein [Sphingomonadaceae bacterium]
MELVSARHALACEEARRPPVYGLSIGVAAMVLATLTPSGTAIAQPNEGRSPDRISSVTVFGNDPCPSGTEDEIVVCGREPESERYRIPKSLREVKYSPPAQSWTSRVHTLDDLARTSMPNSCSVVGTGGQTGCYAHALERWFAERR